MSSVTIVVTSAEQAQQAARMITGNWRAAAAAKKPLIVTIEQSERARTTAQNKRLHALIAAIAEHPINGQRFSQEAIKEYIRRRWVGTEEIDLPDGTRIERGISTSTLSVAECSRLIDAVEAWATTELGIDVNA